MKVLQINSVCGIGSTGRIVTDIHKALLSGGQDSYVAYGRNKPLSCDDPIKIGTKFDNYTHLALTRVFDLHGFGSVKSTKEFIKKIEKLNPDVIHLHNIHGYYINIEILFNYLKRANKKVIWTLHDCWAFTGHCSHFDYIGCEKWQFGCHSCPQQLEYPKSIGLDNSKKNFIDKKDIFTGLNDLTIVTPSNWLKKLVEKSFLKEYPIKVINNGVDLNVFKPTRKNCFRKKNNLDNKFTVLGVANVWGQRKGLNTFIKLANEITEDVKIILVGLSKEEINKIPSNIIAIEKTNNIEELAEIYSCADVFVNPTLEDTFPTTNLEALACGTPIVSYKTGGSGESVLLGVGYTVEKNDYADLVNKIYKVKNNTKSHYYDKCLEVSKKYFDQRMIYKNYINLYHGCLVSSEDL